MTQRGCHYLVQARLPELRILNICKYESYQANNRIQEKGFLTLCKGSNFKLEEIYAGSSWLISSKLWNRVLCHFHPQIFVHRVFRLHFRLYVELNRGNNHVFYPVSKKINKLTLGKIIFWFYPLRPIQSWVFSFVIYLWNWFYGLYYLKINWKIYLLFSWKHKFLYSPPSLYLRFGPGSASLCILPQQPPMSNACPETTSLTL